VTLGISDKVLVLPGSRYSSVDIDISLGAGWPRSTGLLPGRGKRFFSSSKRLDSPVFIGFQGGGVSRG